MRSVALVLCVLSCSRADGTLPPATKPAAESDPPPAYHAYPEIPPDELPDASPAARCQALPAPPPPPPQATRITSGPPVTNHIPPEVIMRPMRTRTSCLRQCWESSPTYSAVGSGRVSVRFVVDVDGYVRKSKPQDVDGLDASVGACVAQQIVGLTFPAPVGGPVTVIYPFRFGSP